LRISKGESQECPARRPMGSMNPKAKSSRTCRAIPLTVLQRGILKDPQRQILEHLPGGIPKVPCPAVYGLDASQKQNVQGIAGISLNIYKGTSGECSARPPMGMHACGTSFALFLAIPMFPREQTLLSFNRYPMADAPSPTRVTRRRTLGNMLIPDAVSGGPCQSSDNAAQG